MPEIIKGINTSEIFEGVITGLIKFSIEKFTEPYIGNGTFKSGAIKLLAGSIVKTAVKNNVGKYVGNALQIDGTEDLAYAIWNTWIQPKAKTQDTGMQTI